MSDFVFLFRSSEAAQAEHGGPQKSGGAKWKATERRLRRLERDGLACSTGRQRGGEGSFEAATYFALDAAPAMDTNHGQRV